MKGGQFWISGRTVLDKCCANKVTSCCQVKYYAITIKVLTGGQLFSGDRFGYDTGLSLIKPLK